MKAALIKLLKNKAKKTAISAATGDQEAQRTMLIVLLPAICCFFILIIMAILILFGPAMLAQQYIDDVNSDVATFFEKVENVLTLKGWCTTEDCEKKAEQKYLEKLDKIYEDYKKNNIEIDVQLITGTIFYGNTMNDNLFNGEDDDESSELVDGSDIKLSDIKKLASNMVSGRSIDYTKYRKYLVETYIPKRFSHLYEGKENKQAEIEKIADEIMMFKSLEEKPLLANTAYGTCKYNVSGNQIDTSNLEVVLLTCDGSRELERVDFETYIKGVVYGEIDAVWPDEVLKAQAIAIRSFTLTRNETMCPGRPNDCNYGYNPKKNEIRMRNCEGDQVYCDYKQGCQKYDYNGYNSLVSGTKNPSMPVYKEALPEDSAKKFEEVLNTVTGQTLMKEDNTIYASAYIDNDQNKWNQMYNENNSLDYNDILIKHYWNKTNSNLTISSNCTNYGVTGEFTEWKQFDPRWANVNIGNNTMHSVGCLVTSISMQFARSGTVILPEFDPGIFANELTKRGSFSPGGALAWDPLRRTINELSNGKFQDVNLDYPLYGTKNEKINTLNDLLNSGNLLVLGVKNEGHWVAIDRIENDKVYIFDPGDSYVTEVTQRYDWGGVTKVQVYKVVP